MIAAVYDRVCLFLVPLHLVMASFLFLSSLGNVSLTAFRASRQLMPFFCSTTSERKHSNSHQKGKGRLCTSFTEKSILFRLKRERKVGTVAEGEMIFLPKGIKMRCLRRKEKYLSVRNRWWSSFSLQEEDDDSLERSAFLSFEVVYFWL